MGVCGSLPNQNAFYFNADVQYNLPYQDNTLATLQPETSFVITLNSISAYKYTGQPDSDLFLSYRVLKTGEKEDDSGEPICWNRDAGRLLSSRYPTTLATVKPGTKIAIKVNQREREYVFNGPVGSKLVLFSSIW